MSVRHLPARPDIERHAADLAGRTAATSSGRLVSLDIIRGIVMVLMAIDHVRVYSGVPPGGPIPAIFFTRWITHFCAPAFVFLAGTGAFFHGEKLGDRRALTRYLVARGALLVVLELTVVRFSWTFNLDYGQFTLAGVIWMLGWCMILLGALIRLTPRTVGWFGVGIVVLQQVFGLIPQALPPNVQASVAPLWNFVYPSGLDGSESIRILYVIVPWIGVMAAGYGFGLLLKRDRTARDRILMRIGLSFTMTFLVLAGLLAVATGGDSPVPFIYRMLAQQKYPASQLFLLMTLGPTIAFIPVADRMRGKFANALSIVGRVPLFYYLIHIPLIHLTALAVNALRTGSMHHEWYGTAPYSGVPEEQQWPLWLLYAVFAFDVAILFLACRWYARIKAERPRAWMRYV